MLSRSERLARSSLFQQVYAGKKRVTTDLLMLYVLPGRTARKSQVPDNTKVAFVVKKNTCKNAVDRNRAKRRIRHAYKAIKKELSEREKCVNWRAVIWIISEKALLAKWEEIKKSVFECLSKADEKYGNK